MERKIVSKKEVALAYIADVIKNILYGLSIFFTTDLLAKGEDGTPRVAVFDLLSTRFLITFLFLSFLLLIRVIKVDFKGKPIKLLIICGIFEPILYFTLESFGLSDTNTMLAGILLSMTPVFTIICEWIVLKEKSGWKEILLIVIGMIGGLVVSLFSITGDSASGSIWGLVFVLLAMLVGRGYVITVRKSSVYFSTWEMMYIYAMIGAVFFNVLNFIIRLRDGTLGSYFSAISDPSNHVGFFYLAILSSIGATSLDMYALSKVQASHLSPLGGINSIVAILAGVFLAQNKIEWYHIVGAVLIIGSSTVMCFVKIKKQSNASKVNNNEK